MSSSTSNQQQQIANKLEDFEFPFCDDVAKYEKIAKIGQGTFGVVINDLSQFPITALREIKILQLLKHENVVNLIEICRTKGVNLHQECVKQIKYFFSPLVTTIILSQTLPSACGGSICTSVLDLPALARALFCQKHRRDCCKAARTMELFRILLQWRDEENYFHPAERLSTADKKHAEQSRTKFCGLYR
ncbi:hypothetical protein V5799_007448 [Amblyomma americanum]|uniref:Protein kinase domain-containing protein n=1 Tax=Amblyomma americanum TaxID=6943 RepID=A0AAQ4FFU9_AMBAM